MPSGFKVKVNHYSGFDGIVGALRDARISGDRVRADLHLLNEHPARDLVLELARYSDGSRYRWSKRFVNNSVRFQPLLPLLVRAQPCL